MPGSATSIGAPSGAELLAQLARVDAQVVGLGVVARAPHLVEQGAVGEDPPGVAGERGEHAELLGREVERGGPRTSPRGRARRSRRSPHLEHRVVGLLVAPRPSQRDPHAGEQLGHRERLGHVVVGALVERDDLAVLGVLGREDDDRHVRPLADGAAQVDAVHVAEAEVEHDGVGLAGREDVQPLAPDCASSTS